MLIGDTYLGYQVTLPEDSRDVALIGVPGAGEGKMIDGRWHPAGTEPIPPTGASGVVNMGEHWSVLVFQNAVCRFYDSPAIAAITGKTVPPQPDLNLFALDSLRVSLDHTVVDVPVDGHERETIPARLRWRVIPPAPRGTMTILVERFVDADDVARALAKLPAADVGIIKERLGAAVAEQEARR